MQLGTTEIALGAVLAVMGLGWAARRFFKRLLADAVHRELRRMSFRWSRAQGGVVLVKGNRPADKETQQAILEKKGGTPAKPGRGREPVSDTAKTMLYQRPEARLAEMAGKTRAVTAEQLAMLAEAEG